MLHKRVINIFIVVFRLATLYRLARKLLRVQLVV